MAATASMAMAGAMWRKPSGGAHQEAAVFSAIQPSAQQEVRAHSSNSGGGAPATENVVCRLNEETANVGGRLPGLSEVPRRGGRRRSRSWHEKKTDNEFDIVIVPSDGCYMSGSDSDDSDWSVGWFEPHPPEFSGYEGEESFGVLVPSYSLSASEFSSHSTGQSDDKDSKAPAWRTLLANISNHTDAESQKQLDLWLQSLTSPS